MIDITDRGCVGDGVTNDTAALKAVWDEAAVTGEDIYAPPGVYAIEPGASPEHFYAGPGKSVTLRGVRGSDAGKQTAFRAIGSGSFLFGASAGGRLQLSDCVVHGDGLVKRCVALGQGAIESRLTNIWALRATDECIRVRNATRSMLHDCKVSDGSGCGLFLGGSNAALVTGLHAGSNLVCGLHVRGKFADATLEAGSVRIIGSRGLSYNGEAQIKIEGAEHAIVDGFYLEPQQADGVVIDGAHNCTVSNGKVVPGGAGYALARVTDSPTTVFRDVHCAQNRVFESAIRWSGYEPIVRDCYLLSANVHAQALPAVEET